MRARVKRTILPMTVMAILTALPVAAQRGDDSDRKSKNGKTTGTVAGVEITLEYGRPNVNGRTIWGGLVPYGEVWRTGANEATTISIAEDVLVEGQELAAGTYALFTIPGEDGWQVIFNSQAQQWGSYDRDPGKDVLTVDVKATEHEHVETMDFAIEGSSIILRWEKLAVPIQIAAAN